MALRSARRLPKKFRRRVSSSTRRVVRHRYATVDRRQRRRKERMARFMRRLSQFGRVVASEFRLWIIIATVVILFTVGAVLLFAPLFDVRQIHVRRQDSRIDPEEVQQILTPIFRRRLVLITRADIKSLLLEAYPDITSVDISKQYPSTLTVSIFLEPILAAIRIDDGDKETSASGTVLTSTGSQQYTYITERGYLISSPIRLTTQALETLTITDWTIRPQDRTVLLDPATVKKIFLARDILRRDFGLPAQKILVYLNAQEFHITTPKVTLWFDVRGGLPLQFERFRIFLKTLSLDQAKEYIDLRIAEKVMYK